MIANPLVWVGLAGIEPDDNARARYWQQRLHGVMIGVALLALPAYLLDLAADSPRLHALASVLDAVIFCAFLLETLWMLHVTSFRTRYLLENWLNLVIIMGSAASAAGAATEWIVLFRVARVAVGSLVLMRAMSEFRVLLTPRGAPLLVGAAVCILLASGGVMFWLEPSIDNYWDGLWLCFVTGMTIGYGDVVPTSPAARAFAVFVAMMGAALVALFTANIVAYFVGRDEPPPVDEERLALNVQQVVRGELAAERTALLAEIRALRAEIADLRATVARPPGPGAS